MIGRNDRVTSFLGLNCNFPNPGVFASIFARAQWRLDTLATLCDPLDQGNWLFEDMDIDMSESTHKLMIIGVIVLAAIALLGVLVLTYFGKSVSVEIAGLGGIAIGGLLGHLIAPDKK